MVCAVVCAVFPCWGVCLCVCVCCLIGDNYRLQYLRFCLFEMYVSVFFVIRCLYSTVSLTLVKEQHFIRIIYYFCQFKLGVTYVVYWTVQAGLLTVIPVSVYVYVFLDLIPTSLCLSVLMRWFLCSRPL